MINDFLDNVLMDFMAFLLSGQDLCKLRDTHFDAGRIPDYSDINIQQLYLLRYAYAYAFEYKYMYRFLLRRLPQLNTIEVTSIGCGSMVDYWALSRVVGDSCTIDYRGIDIIDWYYQFPARPWDSVEYYHKNAIDYLRQYELSSDVYIFPKSISEFSLNEVEQMAECFSPDSIVKDRIHFMFSLRNDQGSMARDTQKTKKLYNKLLQCGFYTADVENRFYHFGSEVSDKTIHSVDSDFKLPRTTIDCLGNLYEFCPQINQCIQRQGCKSRLARLPILRCKYAAWQVFSFERG